jgi:hypothetical protein
VNEWEMSLTAGQFDSQAGHKEHWSILQRLQFIVTRNILEREGGWMTERMRSSMIISRQLICS